jgi:hypothetical protein
MPLAPRSLLPPEKQRKGTGKYFGEYMKLRDIIPHRANFGRLIQGMLKWHIADSQASVM